MFRKKNVEAAIDEAVSRVLSMVESPTARQQYRRILQKYREAKVTWALNIFTVMVYFSPFLGTLLFSSGSISSLCRGETGVLD